MSATMKALSINDHVSKVHLIIASMFTFFGTGLVVNLYLQSIFLTFAAIISSFVLIFAIAFNTNETKKKLYTSLLALAMGFSGSILIEEANMENPQIVWLSLLGMALLFVTFTAASKLIQDSAQATLGAFLFSSLLISIISSMAFIFSPASSRQYITMNFFSLIIFCGYVAYDTKEMYTKFADPLDKHDHYHHAINMFLNLINIFYKLMKLLTLFSQKNKKEKDEKKN
ncbi:MAG: hypothetical protein Harvfovirus4_15 [Harvfovirus sp.]|uniref:Bax inhibitor 1 n=1 Tax=Harvfovirus sp. TaxID=2487768 RepID=A0A3G5A391_9VIRU|nr:MAG: hypothetical protein Harvfovirus4_15 [Harvfovirus sp.]